MEIFGDGTGNDNGLCESGENCIYTPNIGSYQGYGDLVPLSAISSGTLSNINLYKYSVNGY
ncbi:MAG TPA: hypothetical protein PL048_10535 [Leptospiraceae bacterium]|nr:hypothetical protein [Leptospiraceae bacterium]